jgi:phage baseplate assembly protein W
VADTAKAFLGIGWAFPPCLSQDGATAMAAYENDVRQAIWIILSTDRGERLLRPDFGAGLRSLVFGPLSRTTLQRVQTRVQEALVTWEPRIDVESVNVTFDPNQPGRLSIEVVYRIRVTNARHNLVYPFFLDEGATS